MAVALIVAAGSGERLGASRPKAFVTLAGKPMVQWSVEAMRAAPSVGEIRAKDIREGLRRLQEINLVDRYLQT